MSSFVVEMLNMLPEDCMSHIISLTLTSPADACRVSTMSTTLRSAADSDGVWNTFLPSDYQQFIARSAYGSFPPLADFATKKQLYLRLCDTPLLIDDGKKSFSLDKWTGKKCFMIAARELEIIWGGMPEYWGWISLPESRFAEVAELLEVCWLDIRCNINTGMLSPGTKYAAYLVFKLTENAYGFEHHPVVVSIDTFGLERSIRTLYRALGREMINLRCREKMDGWKLSLGSISMRADKIKNWRCVCWGWTVSTGNVG